MNGISFAAAMLTALPYFLRLEIDEVRNVDRKQFRHEDKKTKRYDFIVVGGGIGGCVVAGRLSEKFNVLLLEAGGEPPSGAEVPAFHSFIDANKQINYAYTSVPQEKANNRKIGEVQGKMLGGSGSSGGLIYSRGHPKDYDNWARMTKDHSWKYSSLLKYFKKAATYHGTWPQGSHHGSNGPIHLVTSTHPIVPLWLEAGKELGYETVDPNAPQREGFSPTDVMREHGRRISTYNTYVQPYMTWRETLTVVRYAYVHNILFRGSRARGVAYVRHGVNLKAYATKEVIISAGAYATPLLLFRSGIGPEEVLAAANIKQRVHLPVGRNLQNHPGVVLGPFSVTDSSKLSNVNNNLTEEDFKLYLKGKRGTVMSEAGLGPMALLVSPLAKARGESDWPDFQFVHVATNFAGKAPNEPVPANQFFLIAFVGRPEFSDQNLGQVTLNSTAFAKKSANNAELAEIDFKFLESERDFEVLKYALKTGLKVFNTEPFKKIGTTYIKDAECGRSHSVHSDGYWRCYIRSYAHTFYHPAGTCRMGYGKRDKNSVVDSKLRVHGVTGLRIIDASVMPQVTNSNTNAPVIVIAEKASADILETYDSD